MTEFQFYRTPGRAKKLIREYGLGPGIANITVFGTGPEGKKSGDIIRKSKMLEKVGLLFPRRNLVLKADVLAEGIASTGSREGWKGNSLPEGELSREAFDKWCKKEIWPLVENTFEGRAIYVRSDAPGDSLGRGVYDSVPFPNREGIRKDQSTRPEEFSRRLFQVIKSYFSDTAKAFSEACGDVRSGMSVFLSQFVGQPAKNRGVLMPFMSGVIKSTLFKGTPGNGIVRFEYGMGKGALSGRTIIVENGVPIETIFEKKRAKGVYCSWVGTNVTGFNLTLSEEIKLDDSKWALLSNILSEAYPLAGKSVDTHGKSLLKWLIKNIPKIENENGGPIYLELVCSSFKNRLRWFVVQVADYPPMHQIPPSPKDVQFVSNSDFYGHGEVKRTKTIYLFSREAFKSKTAMEQMAEINREKKDFVFVLPQDALTGTNLTSLSGTYFSNASAVLEYQILGDEGWRGSLHKEPSCEHFEQLCRDLNILFIPVERLKLGGLERSLTGEHPLVLTGDVHLACDKERRIAWGSLTNLKQKIS